MNQLPRMSALQGDITKLEVDAIVNAANSTLLGGGGVDGAIHRAAGPELLDECRGLGGCEVGQAKATKGYFLPATWVIHTVGPIWYGGTRKEAQDLASCYEASLTVAQSLGAKTVAFPCISTGAFGYPFREASQIAIAAVERFLQKNECIASVVFVCFQEGDFQVYQQLLAC